MFKSLSVVEKKPLTQTEINEAFSEIIRRHMVRLGLDVYDFARIHSMSVELANKIMHGQHDWLGFVTYRELDLMLRQTPGHNQQVYKNIVEKVQ